MRSERVVPKLRVVIQTYAKNVGGMGIGFTEAAYPHWFMDKNGNGRIDPEQISSDNTYHVYTPRLLEAAVRDPGGAYHNGQYVLELLHRRHGSDTHDRKSSPQRIHAHNLSRSLVPT